MSKRTDREFLSDILEAQDAVVRNLEIIGEATKRLSDEVRTRYPAIPWRSMAGVRDRLIHDYFGISLDVVWEIVSVELGEVALQVEDILRELGKSNR
jgi:uncharacterized protein with HEPN domain